jgi:hypothetical protein
MYDAVAEAIPLVQQGQFRKKALVVISDGNDTSSSTRLRDVQQQIRESEALVYAVGIDCSGSGPTRRRSAAFSSSGDRRFRSRFRSHPGGPRWWLAAPDAAAAERRFYLPLLRPGERGVAPRSH